METRQETHGDVILMTVAGRVDLETAASFEESLQAAISKAAAGVVVDLSGVEYISSIGLRALMIGANESETGGKGFAVVALQPMVREVLQIAGLDKVIRTFDMPDAALKAITEQAATHDGA